MAAARADAVTEWSVEADRLGAGRANWRSLAIMHAAMHDALNAIEPRYQRWSPPERDEPAAPAGGVEAAMDAAAAEALKLLHPLHESEIDQVYQRLIKRVPAGSVEPAVLLGRAIGAAAANRHKDDGYYDLYDFPASKAVGKWQPTPPYFEAGLINSMQPFLFPSRAGFEGRPPPPVGSPAYLADLDETYRLGGQTSAERTEAQAGIARFWAFQSSQRGFLRLAVTLLERDARPFSLAAHAQIMSQLTAALADSAILIWSEKERYVAWRPITAIRAGGAASAADPQWAPLIETPGHPEYPSGHASDCYVGAGFLAAVFGPRLGPVVYVSQGHPARIDPASPDMGQHAQPGDAPAGARRFASLGEAAAECAESRIWAGAHFRSAEDESRRVAAIIVAAALRRVPRS